MCRCMTHIFLGMGSNQGDRRANLASGIGLLRNKMSDMACSSLYETDPVGVTGQPQFLNLVVTGQTTLGPRELLSWVKSIEERVGRRPTFRWGPRVLDIDILLYGYESVTDSDLTIPHPQLLDREFVLVPLCEIAPRVTLPDGSSPCSVLDRRGRTHAVRLVGRLEETPGRPDQDLR